MRYRAMAEDNTCPKVRPAHRAAPWGRHARSRARRGTDTLRDPWDPDSSVLALTHPRCIYLLASLALLLAVQTPGPWAATSCTQGQGTRIWVAPADPRPGEPLDLLAVSTEGEIDQIMVTAPGGRAMPSRPIRGSGPPWSAHTGISRPERGTYRVEAVRRGRTAACLEVPVGTGRLDQGSGEWDLATQAFYAVWVERLFDAPPDATLSFPSLAPVLADPMRNFLYGYLGADEDRRLPAEPDCADLPYFLRTYFAWKMGLPIAYRACSRGSRNAPPRCQAPIVDDGFARSTVSAQGFRGVTRKLVDTVHSGSGRTALGDEATDFYPVPLEREYLWPGTVFADPYGHILIITKWIPQAGRTGGQLLAVDAQPDNSVTRKRFWEGTFLFAQTPSAGAGFKAHRPLVRTRSGWTPASNASLDGRSGLPPYSSEQSRLSPEDFYARMARLINPGGQDPEGAYASTLEALMEQLETRVTSVDNGEAYMRGQGRGVMSMPSGPAIFETTGPWEDYATPSRDMRLLIAMHVAQTLPERIRRYPELYLLRGQSPTRAAQRIEALHARESQNRSITYTRSDGSPWRLTLADLYTRRRNLEMAYNPNDCVERRWGAAPGDPDDATCKRQAPAEQRKRMEQYRPWFAERRRPPR